MAKDDPGYVQLSTTVGVLYGFLFLVAVVLAIVLPCVIDRNEKTENRSVEEIVRWKKVEYSLYEHDPFQATLDPFTLWGTSEEAQAAFAKLDLKGKFGQMSLWDVGNPTGPGLDLDYDAIAQQGGAGTYINAVTWDKVKKYQDLATAGGHLPILFAFDTIHGFSTVFPINLALSCSWDPTLVETLSSLAAKEMKAVGVRATFAPMVDVARDARWGRTMESSGEDPYLNGLFGAATVRGFQKEGVAACVKHIGAYGLPEAGLDYMATRASALQLHNEFLRPYRWAMKGLDLDASPGSVDQAWMAMAAYHLISGVPAHGHAQLMTDTLRGSWDWEGLVVADYGGVYQQRAQRYVADSLSATKLSIGAGINQNMGDRMYWDLEKTDDYYAALEKEYYRNRTLADHIDLAAKRVVALKDKLGLFQSPYPDTAPPEGWEYNTETLDAAEEAALKSCVLLENKESTLPIKDAENNRYLLVGSMADSVRDLLGGWLGKHNQALGAEDEEMLATHGVTYRQGIQNMLGNPTTARLNYLPGYVVSRSSRLTYDENTNALKALTSDLDANSVGASGNPTPYSHVIVVLGEPGIAQGESTSRTNITITEPQWNVVDAVKKYKEKNQSTKLVFVYIAGRALAITEEAKIADAILYTWSAGLRGGNAVAKLLFGEAAPTGKLTVTFPRSVGQLPIYYARHPSGRPHQTKIGDPLMIGVPLGNGNFMGQPLFTSDYIDEYVLPLYPFGYGLTYGVEFSIAEAALSPSSATLRAVTEDKAKLQIDVTVKTSGAHELEVSEVVQVYVRDIVASQSRPMQQLVGFSKVVFPKGVTEAKTSVVVDLYQHLGFYNQTLHYNVEPGQFTFTVARYAYDQANKTLSFEITP